MQYIEKYELDWVIKRLNTEPANWKKEYEAAMLSIVHNTTAASQVVLNNNQAGVVLIAYNKFDGYAGYDLVVITVNFCLSVPNRLVDVMCKESTADILTVALLGSPISSFTSEENKVFIHSNETAQMYYGWRGDNCISFINRISFKRKHVRAPTGLTACRHYF